MSMRKRMSLLAVVLLFLMVSAIPVLAKNGPHSTGYISTTKIDQFGFDGTTIMQSDSEDGYIYSPSEKVKKIKGISYDKASNTLTLKNYKNAKRTLLAYNMGDDFKIKLIGSNELMYIGYNASGYNTNLTFIGNGSIVLNRKKFTYGIGGISPSSYGKKYDLKLTIGKNIKMTIYPKKVSGPIEVYGSPILVMNSRLSKSKAIVIKPASGSKIKINKTTNNYGTYYHTDKVTIKIK